MSEIDEEITRVEAAIQAQEGLRGTLGDAVVDLTVTALRARIEELRSRQVATRGGEALSPEELLSRLRRYLPVELAEKMQATGRIEGERKQVTVMFADLSGFTALSEQLDPEDVTALINDALKELAAAVYQYEGYVDKFVGDAVMAVFGAPVAHEDDAVRALRAALAMRERVEALNRHWGARLQRPIAIHVGVNSGEVIAGTVGSDLRLSYTVMGDTVNTAARLEGAAGPGQVLVSRATRRLSGEAFTFRELEPLQVKGKREPIPTFELLRARLRPGTSRGLAGVSARLVGRAAELSRLREVGASLAAGRGTAVLICGEPGIGKSRLLAEWRQELGDGIRWLEGRAFSHTGALAYGPFLDLLRQLAEISDDDAEALAARRLQQMVARYLPGDDAGAALLARLLALTLTQDQAALLARLSPESVGRRLFGTLETLFVRLAQERPTVLVLEDLHWADRTSTELLERLLDLTMRLPLSIVVVSRLEPIERLLHLRTVLASRLPERSIEITLAPLAPSDSLVLLGRLLESAEQPEQLRELAVRRGEGNPFFIEELIRALIERGALRRGEGGQWEATPLLASVTVPDTLQGLLMARLDRLPDETKWVVQQAAVIGRIFLYRVLRQLASTDQHLDADLDQLQRGDLIRERAREPEVEYVFKHALTQEVAYQSLLVARRKELHGRVAEALEALFADRLAEHHGVLARHCLRAEHWDKAYEYSLQAGVAALRLFARTEARLHFGEALGALAHLPDTADQRRQVIDATLRLVSISAGEGQPERDLGRLVQAERLALELAAGGERTGEDRLQLARVGLALGWAHYQRGTLTEGIATLERARGVAEELGDQALHAACSNALGQTLGRQGRFAEMEDLLRQALPGLEQAGNWAAWVLGTGALGITLVLRGRVGEGLEHGRRALERAGQIDNLTSEAVGHGQLGTASLFAGQPLEAERHGRAALEAAQRSDNPYYVQVTRGFLSWALARLGRMEAARAFMDGLSMPVQPGGASRFKDWFAVARAEIALAAGEPGTALELVDRALKSAEENGDRFAIGWACRVRAAALVAARPEAWPEAEEALRVGLGELGACDAQLEVSRTHLLWGHLCAARGEIQVARGHLELAAAGLEAAGCPEERDLARHELAQLGPPRQAC